MLSKVVVLGFACSSAVSFAGNFSAEDLLLSPFFKVVDTDANGLNCRFTPAGDINTKLNYGDTFLAYEKLAYDVRGEPWMFLRIDASGCYVRASSKFMAPAGRQLDYTETFWEAESPAAGAFKWIVVDKTPLNCRAKPENGAVVTTLSRFTELADVVSGGHLHSKYAINGLTYASGKPWFIVENRESAKICYVRANSNFVRPSGEVP